MSDTPYRMGYDLGYDPVAKGFTGRSMLTPIACKTRTAVVLPPGYAIPINKLVNNSLNA